MSDNAVDFPLTAAERQHLINFQTARPDWNMVWMTERFRDETIGQDNPHAYHVIHPYVSGMCYVMRRIIPLAPCKIIDIGSPVAQVAALACIPGVEVTVVDIRDHPDPAALGVKWITGSATALPFQDGTVPLLTSCWTMAHVGDGRYGDPFDIDGDIHMVNEVARVLQPDGTAILGFGLLQDKPGMFFNAHRIFSWEWIDKEFTRAGLEIVNSLSIHSHEKIR